MTLNEAEAEWTDRLLATCADCKSCSVTDTRDSAMIPDSELANERSLD